MLISLMAQTTEYGPGNFKWKFNMEQCCKRQCLLTCNLLEVLNRVFLRTGSGNGMSGVLILGITNCLDETFSNHLKSLRPTAGV